MFNYFEYNIFLNIYDKNLLNGKQKRASQRDALGYGVMLQTTSYRSKQWFRL